MGAARPCQTKIPSFLSPFCLFVFYSRFIFLLWRCGLEKTNQNSFIARDTELIAKCSGLFNTISPKHSQVFSFFYFSIHSSSFAWLITSLCDVSFFRINLFKVGAGLCLQRWPSRKVCKEFAPVSKISNSFFLLSRNVVYFKINLKNYLAPA